MQLQPHTATAKPCRGKKFIVEGRRRAGAQLAGYGPVHRTAPMNFSSLARQYWVTAEAQTSCLLHTKSSQVHVADLQCRWLSLGSTANMVDVLPAH